MGEFQQPVGGLLAAIRAWGRRSYKVSEDLYCW
jgi:hypothetical protein